MIWGYFAFGEDVEENVIVEISNTFPKFGTIPSIGLFMNAPWLQLVAVQVLSFLTYQVAQSPKKLSLSTTKSIGQVQEMTCWILAGPPCA